MTGKAARIPRQRFDAMASEQLIGEYDRLCHERWAKPRANGGFQAASSQIEYVTKLLWDRANEGDELAQSWLDAAV